MSLDFLNSGGWDAINQATQQPEKTPDEVKDELLAEYELASMVSATFASEGPGRAVLAELRANTIDKPTLNAGPPSLVHTMMDMQITPEQWLWMRAGQNSVIHWIEAQILKAIEGPPEFEDESEGEVTDDT